MSITITEKELSNFAKEFIVQIWERKTKKPEPSKKEEKITKKFIRDKLKTSKTVGQSYYNIDTKKTHTANPKAKKEFLFYDIGDIHISGKKESSRLTKALQDLGFEDVEPISFEKKKPVKKVVKKHERRIAFDEDKGLFGEDIKTRGKEVFIVYYEPNIDPEQTENNRSVIGKWSKDEEKTVKLTQQEAIDFHKMGIPLYHMKNKKRPVKRVTTQKEIESLVKQMKGSAFFKSMESKSDNESEEGPSEPERPKKEKEPETEVITMLESEPEDGREEEILNKFERQVAKTTKSSDSEVKTNMKAIEEDDEDPVTEVITMLDSESEPEGPEDGREEEILNEFERQVAKTTKSSDSEEEDEAEANMKAIDDVIEDDEGPEITKEDFEKYKANMKLSSDFLKMSEVTGLTEKQIFFIANNYDDLSSKYPETRKPKSKKHRRRLGRKL